MRDEADSMAALVEEALRRVARVCCEEAARLANTAPATADALIRVRDRLLADDEPG